MKKVVFIALLLCCASIRAQKPTPNNNEVMFPFGDHAFKIKDVELNNNVIKEHFIKQALIVFKEEHSFLTGGKGNLISGDQTFRSALHVIDINNDGLYDLIYVRNTGGDVDKMVIALNTKKGLKRVWEVPGALCGLEFKDHKLFRISIHVIACCLGYVVFDKVYQFAFPHNDLQPDMVYLSSRIAGTHMPKKYFEHPVKFEVLNDMYKMRLEPVIDDNTKVEISGEGLTIKGNAIDTLNKGTKGRAIATETDKTGRVWWLVEIDHNFSLYGNLFYEENNDKNHKASKMGWISSRFVKKLD